MTKPERLIEEARELPAGDRLRLIEEVGRSVDDETDASPLGSRDYEPLVALAGTGVSEFQDVSTDKYRHLGEAYAPTVEEESELLEAIAGVERGETVRAEDLLRHLRR